MSFPHDLILKKQKKKEIKTNFSFLGGRMRIALYTKMKRPLAAGHLSKVFFFLSVGSGRSVGRVKKLFPPVRILKFFLASPCGPLSLSRVPEQEEEEEGVSLSFFKGNTRKRIKSGECAPYISKSMEYVPPAVQDNKKFSSFFRCFFLIRFSACDASQLERKTGRSGNTPTSRLSHF